MDKKVKELENIRVMYTNAYGEPAEIASQAFSELETVVSPKGRKFYGTFYPEKKEYRACVRIEKPHDREIRGLTYGAIEGGLYAYEKVKGNYQDIIKRIAPTFQAMQLHYLVDRHRPSVEFYRRHDEVILYLPIINS